MSMKPVWIRVSQSYVWARQDGPISQTVGAMDEDYDIFEICSDRSVTWRVRVHGTQLALAVLQAIGKQTASECFASNIGTREVIARINGVADGGTNR
jgi:hypothetical protein